MARWDSEPAKARWDSGYSWQGLNRNNFRPDIKGEVFRTDLFGTGKKLYLGTGKGRIRKRGKQLA